MTIGFIGLGIMGEPMSKNLLKKRTNDTLVVFDINPARIDLLTKEVVEKSDVIFSIVPKSEHVQSLCKDIQSAFKPGKIWADMSTIDPGTSIEVSQEISKTGAIFLDCPLVKSKAAAIDGTLGIYIGGDKAAFEKINDLLLCIGTNGAGLS
ncbi:MAG: NAD(P)-dependent oxidoreductase [Brevinema sp.]